MPDNGLPAAEILHILLIKIRNNPPSPETYGLAKQKCLYSSVQTMEYRRFQRLRSMHFD